MARQKRKTPLRDHPFWEEAQLLRALLREDKELAHRGSSIIIFPDPDTDWPRAQAEAQKLEHLARIDMDYPEEDCHAR
jgi:hypothetical protein